MAGFFRRVFRYVPQVYLNAVRKSTDGWNIDNVVLDFLGGGPCVYSSTSPLLWQHFFSPTGSLVPLRGLRSRLAAPAAVLSVAQLILDAVTARDWTAVTGDPVKFGARSGIDPSWPRPTAAC